MVEYFIPKLNQITVTSKKNTLLISFFLNLGECVVAWGNRKLNCEWQFETETILGNSSR